MLKKVLTLVLAVTMLCCSSITAFAVEEEAEPVVPHDTIITSISLPGSNLPVLLYDGYTLLGGTIDITNVYASPGPVNIRIINSASENIVNPTTINLSQTASFKVPALTGEFKIVISAPTAGIYYLNISGAIINNPNPNVEVKLVKVSTPGVFYSISEVTTGLLQQKTLNVTNSAYAPGNITIQVLNSASGIVATVSNVAPGQSSGSIILDPNDRYTINVAGSVAGTYQVSYTVQ